MGYSEILTKVKNGDYTSKVTIPTPLPFNHIFDPEMSVNWNVNKMREHRQSIANANIKFGQEERRIYQEFETDLRVAVFEDLRSVTNGRNGIDMATMIVDKAFEDAHSEGYSGWVLEAKVLTEWVKGLLAVGKGGAW